MNHDAPMTPAAMQAHIAELEQQLLACQTELAKHSAAAENITLTLPQLYRFSSGRTKVTETSWVSSL